MTHDMPITLTDRLPETSISKRSPRTRQEHRMELRQPNDSTTPAIEESVSRTVVRRDCNHARAYLPQQDNASMSAGTKRKRESFDAAPGVTSVKRIAQWKVPISRKASRIYLQGGPGWVKAYRLEWERFKDSHETNYPNDREDFSESKFLELLDLESLNPEIERKPAEPMVVMWGEPRFMEKQRAVLEDGFFNFQRSWHYVKALKSLHDLPVVQVDFHSRVEWTLHRAQTSIIYEDMQSLEEDWCNIKPQVMAVLRSSFEKDKVGRFSRSMVDLRDEVLIWEDLQSSGSGRGRA